MDRACAASDDALLGDCDMSTFRGGGPGGQKRNKTSNAVRLTHRPTGHQASAGETRSLAENKALALHRLRLRLAVEERRRGGEAVTLMRHVARGRLDVRPTHVDYPLVVAELLDVMQAVDWGVGDAARWLGVSTNSVSDLITADKLVLTKVNAERRERGYKLMTGG